jgi:hypothetical protein
MANTLKFGNGQWATKVGSTLAYNDEGGNFKPLPFNFTRSTSATRVNKDGLIEVVTNNKPRIDFLNDSNGALLLEPERTNLVTTSEDFVSNAWFNSKARVTLEDNSTIAPDGNLNATKLISTNENNSHYIRRGTSDYSDAVTRTFSVYLKYGNEQKEITVLYQNKNVIVQFNSNGILSHVSNTASFYKIEDYGNGWYKVIISDTVSGGNFLYSGIYTENNQDGTSFFYIWGAQLEQGSYATSYIPTQGAISTKVAEVCNNSGNEQVINSTEGVLYAEISALADGGVIRSISIFSAADNRITLALHSTTNRVQFFIAMNGYINTVDLDATDIVQTDTNKIACKFKANDYALWINGIEKDTNTTQSNTVQSGTLNSLNFDINGSNNFYGNVKDLKIYNTALTDAELQALTSN